MRVCGRHNSAEIAPPIRVLLFMRTEPEGRPSRAATAVEVDVLPLVVSFMPYSTLFRLVGVGLTVSRNIYMLLRAFYIFRACSI